MTTHQAEYHGGVEGVIAAVEEAKQDFDGAVDVSSEHGARIAVAVDAHEKFLALLQAAAGHHKDEVTPSIIVAGRQTSAAREHAKSQFDVSTDNNPLLDSAMRLMNKTVETSEAERAANNNVVTAYEEAQVASNAIAALLDTINAGTAGQPDRLNEMGGMMGASADNLRAYEQTT